ncbi:MAG TPA: thiol reductant ABC exporter subunit CydD [Calditrichaeota bacterium]|nr:thiol reductant ABC exporter subunit CydD [Calditrichota bacterium]
MNLDKRLLGFLKEVSPAFLASVAAGLAAAVSTIGLAWYLSVVVNRVFFEHDALSEIYLPLTFFAALSIAKSLFAFVSEDLANETARNIKNRIRKLILSHLNAAGPVSINKERSGELTNTLLNGVEALDVYFSKYIPQLFFAVLVPVLILIFVFPSDLLSGFVLLLTAPLIPLFMILIGKAAEAQTQKQWKTLSRLSAHFLDMIQGLTELKLLGQSKKQSRNIAKLSNDFRETTMKVLRIAFLSALVLELAATISTAVVAVQVGLRLLYFKIDFQHALFILVLAPEFYQPFRQLGARFHAGMEGVQAAERIFEVLKTKIPHKVSAHRRNSLPTATLQEIRFSGVYFNYPTSEKDVLQNISFRIQKGEILAVVGPSGAGKSTLMHLLLRFIEPAKGSITVNGHPLSEIPAGWWRRQIAWLPQKPYLFHTSIYENIRLAKPDATKEQIIHAARKARLHDFVQTLPAGYNTPVGEGAALFSGGQAQRMALARAFLKNAPVVILDEPTSNLDPLLEEEISRCVKKLLQNRLGFIIAHRLNTIRNASQIIVLKNGRIYEQGTHEILLKSGKLYEQMMRSYTGEQR